MTDEKYTLEEIREAFNRVTTKTLNFPQRADDVIAELTRPKHNFRKGEVIVDESGHGSKIIRASGVDCDSAYRFQYCRSLRLSEMPQAVEDLREWVECCANGGDIITGDVAVRILAKFDAEIEK